MFYCLSSSGGDELQATLVIHAPRPAFRGNDAHKPSCVSRSIRGARDGRAMVQSESSGLDRRARGFANITVGSCAYNTRGRAVGTVSMPGSNAAICHTSCSRTVIEGPARARGRSLELDLVWSDRGRSGQEAVVCEHVSTDPSLRPGCHELRWEREGRRTLDETETLDERRKRLPGTPRGCIRKPRAARSIRPCVRRESGLWHERGCDT